MLSEPTVHAMLIETSRLRERFAATAPRPWNPTTATTELLVQVGHLGLCLLRERGSDVSLLCDPERQINNLGDELADVVLATLSVCTLAEVTPFPSCARPSRSTTHVDDFTELLVAAGALSEAVLVATGFRHHPTGTPPTPAEAAAWVLDRCDALANRARLDLHAEFTAMVADAHSFLDAWEDRDE